MGKERKIIGLMERAVNQIKEGRGALFVPPGESRLRYAPPKKDYPYRHIHHYPEIFFQIGQSCRFTFEGGEHIMTPGSMVIIPPMTSHPEEAIGSHEDFLNLVVMVSPSQVGCHLARAREGVPRVEEAIMVRSGKAERIIALEEIMIDLFYSGRPELIPFHLETLLFYFKEFYLEKGREPGYSDKVIRACSLVRMELGNSRLNGEYVARRLGCSRDYLSHLFRREMGERLTAYIARERVARARNLLLHSELNCSETAWACGFSSPAYFNRVFKEQTGYAPGEYRSALRRDG